MAMVFWYGVVAARVERVASQKSANCQITPFEKTKTFDCLHGIAGARRAKTTVLTENWANKQFVTTQ